MELKELYNNLNLEEDFFSKITYFINKGDSKLQQNRIVETMIIDDSWVDTISSLIYSVEQIVKNPKKFIIDENVLVNVEKAKKINASTIRHLASHTNLIRAVDEKGKIQPSKVLTKEMQEDIFIYENRFVYTLIVKLTAFIEERYTAIKDQIDTFDTTNLRLHSKFKLSRGEVEYDMNIKVREEQRNKITLEKNLELLRKIEIIRKRLLMLKSSVFCKLLSTAKLVNPPIMKTNILNMHTDYKNCYKLWMFISSYIAVGYSVEVADKKLPVDTDYYDDLTMLVAISLKTMLDNNAIRSPVYKKINFSKKQIKNFKEIKKIEYTPSFRGVAGIDNKDIINQYYFDNLKRLISEKESLKSNEIENVEGMKVTFQRFFKSVTKLTNALYEEILGISKYSAPIKKQTALQKKQLAYKKQEELYKKYQMLSRMKSSELSQTLSREITQKVKLERAKYEYELLTDKQEKKKKKKLVVHSNAKDKMDRVYEKAQREEALRLEKELKRQRILTEKEKERLLNLEKARQEKKRLRELRKQEEKE